MKKLKIILVSLSAIISFLAGNGLLSFGLDENKMLFIFLGALAVINFAVLFVFIFGMSEAAFFTYEEAVKAKQYYQEKSEEEERYIEAVKRIAVNEMGLTSEKLEHVVDKLEKEGWTH